jgi:hypothetical protein
MTNTFIIPVYLFEKMMSWMEQYFVKRVDPDELFDIVAKNPGHLYLDPNVERINLINPGHLIEILTGMFLALEMCQGCNVFSLQASHIHDLKV